jgi:enoyl-CoA hydratase/carnithine racemase/acyl dehydratase
MSTTTNEAYTTTFEKLEHIKDAIGKEVGLSDWYEITQELIDDFAENTGDYQWIHINPEMAKAHSPYKTTVAHGFLVLSLASKIVTEAIKINDVAMAVNYGLNKVRFPNATPVGALIRARVSVLDYKEIPGGARYVMNVVFEIKGEEKPACVAEWIGQSYVGPTMETVSAAMSKDEPAEEENTAVLYSKEGKVGVITLNRPERYNGINKQLLDAFSIALDKAKMDKGVRAVVLHGNGKGFCAGADLVGGTSLKPAQIRDFLNKNYGDVIRRLSELEKPVIAAIHGSAAGAGLGFALGADFRVMGQSANMRYAFINIGLAPDAGSSWFLTRAVGYSKALEIATEGEKIPAEECLRLGLTNKMVADDQLMDTAMNWAKKLAERPTLAFALTKKDIKYGMTHGLLDTIAYEAEQQVQALSSLDHKEGVISFIQKRAPKFIGK